MSDGVGLRSLDRSSSSSAFAASPTTSKPASRRIRPRPSRTSSESSAIATRAPRRYGAGAESCAFGISARQPGYGSSARSAFHVRVALDRQSAVECMHAIRQTGEARACSRFSAADAVVRRPRPPSDVVLGDARADAADACACLATFASASETTK